MDDNIWGEYKTHTVATMVLALTFLAQVLAYGIQGGVDAVNGGFDNVQGPYYYLTYNAVNYTSSKNVFDMTLTPAVGNQNLLMYISSQILFLLLGGTLIYLALWYFTKGVNEIVRFSKILALGLALMEIIAWTIIQGLVSFELGEDSAVSFARLIGVVGAFAGIMLLGDVDRNIMQHMMGDYKKIDDAEQQSRAEKGDTEFGYMFVLAWFIAGGFLLILFVPLMLQLGVTANSPVPHDRPAFIDAILGVHIADLAVQFIVFSSNISQRVYGAKGDDWVMINKAMMYGAHVMVLIDVAVFVWVSSSFLAKTGNLVPAVPMLTA